MSCPDLEGRVDRGRREQWALRLAQWAGGDLPAGEAARVERHLAACPACRELAEGLRASQEGLASLAAEPPDPEALARIRAGVLRRVAEEAPRAARRRAALHALAATLVAGALGLAIWLRMDRAEVALPPEPGATEAAAAPERARGPEPETSERREATRPGAVREPTRTVPARPGPQARREPRTAAPDAPAAGPGPSPSPEASVRRAARRPPSESMVIRVVSDDPDIVYYWLIEPEETQNEAVNS